MFSVLLQFTIFLVRSLPHSAGRLCASWFWLKLKAMVNWLLWSHFHWHNQFCSTFSLPKLTEVSQHICLFVAYRNKHCVFFFVCIHTCCDCLYGGPCISFEYFFLLTQTQQSTDFCLAIWLRHGICRDYLLEVGNTAQTVTASHFHRIAFQPSAVRCDCSLFGKKNECCMLQHNCNPLKYRSPNGVWRSRELWLCIGKEPTKGSYPVLCVCINI